MAQSSDTLYENKDPQSSLAASKDSRANQYLEILRSWYGGGGSNSETSEGAMSSRIELDAYKVNESLYELCKPVGSPKMEILFFHGLHLGDSQDVHLRTWDSLDGSCIWPKEWLSKEFPGARILTVSYEGIVGQKSNETFDMKIITENLLSDFMSKTVGQTPHCPVILVGHCFGGLVIKQLCLEASARLDLTRYHAEKTKLQTFLKSIKGIFYYGVPHHGNAYIDKVVNMLDSPVLGFFKTLSKDAARLNYSFSQLCRKYNWRTAGLGESLINEAGLFKGVVAASEATSREGDQFNVVAANHLEICRPADEKDRRFYSLTGFLRDIARESIADLDKDSEMPVHQCQGLPDYPAQLEGRAQDVIGKLSEGGVLGIFGMGGIGKTTLARQTFNTISQNFEYSCFVDNVKGVSSDKLVSRVLACFHHRGIGVKKGGLQWSDLKEKKTLVVVDDVDSVKQLNVLPKMLHFGKGSCLIMTGRNREVFKFYPKFLLYEVGFLEPHDAKKLFCHHAFGQEGIPDSLIQKSLLEEKVKAVVGKCGGLPLTLEVLGRYLQGHQDNLKIWEGAIDKLGKAKALSGKDDEVWASLRVSYDALEKDEQQIFRDAATFFFEQPLDQALAAWSTCCENSELSWANLVNRSMVKEVWKEKFVPSFFTQTPKIRLKEVWVHEHLRDLAKKVQYWDMVSGSWDTAPSLINRLNANEVNAETRSLRLVSPYGNQEPALQVDLLFNLEELKFAEFKEVSVVFTKSFFVEDDVIGESLTRNLSLLKWSGQVSIWSLFPININYMTSLAVLELENCRVPKDFPEALGKLTNLQFLSLRQLLGFDRLPENLGIFARLKWFELEHLESVKLPKSVGTLSALEYLFIREVQCLELPESIGDLSSLSRLDIRQIKSFSGLPDSFGRGNKSLKELFISKCPLPSCLPHCVSKLAALERLVIDDCDGLEELGDSFGDLTALRELEVTRPNLQSLPASFVRLVALQKLVLKGGTFKSLPDDFGRLTALKKLDIDNSYLETLPDSFRLLTSLRELTLRCIMLEKLSEGLGELVQLETLDLDVMAALPASVGKLSSLVTLEFTSTTAELLPNSLGCLTALRRLQIDCRNLKSLCDSLGTLSSLEHLTINSSSLDTLPETIGGLRSLRILNLKVLSLRSLPETIGGLHSLRSLYLEVRSLRSLPESIKQLSSLRELDFECDGHMWMPKGFEHFPIAQIKLTLTGYGTSSLPAGLGVLSPLRDLELNFIMRLERLPKEIGQLSSLAKLKISQCYCLESLPDSLGCISSLRDVELSYCKRLKTLPDSLGRCSLPEMAPAPGESSDPLRSEAAGSSSQPAEAEGTRLNVYECPLLSDSVLRNSGWTLTSGDPSGNYKRRYYQRKSPHEISL